MKCSQPLSVLLLLSAAFTLAAALPSRQQQRGELDFFPGPFERPSGGGGEVPPPCAEDFDFSDCDPEEASFFGFQANADDKHAGARGMLVYSNGAIVPVEGKAIVKTRTLLLSALNRALANRDKNAASGQGPDAHGNYQPPTVVEVLNYGGGR